MRRRTMLLLPLALAGGAAAASLSRRPGAPPARDPSPDAGLTLQRVAMGTLWQVVLPAGAPAHAAAAASRALDEVQRLEDVLSEFRPGTEVSRINAAAGERPVRVSNDTWYVTEQSLRYAALSDGAFDPTWAAMRSLWDFRSPTPLPPDPAEVQARLPLVDWRAVELDPAARTIRLRRPGMALGFGGIAKGYALDRMRALLLEAGVRDFVLYSGGQVLAEGTRGGRPWRVGVQHPRDPDGLLGALSITAASVSTGGDYEHSFQHEGRRYHHVIDPHTGWPVEHTASVTIIARTALDADALDTALFVMPPARAMAKARELGVAMLRTDPAMRSEMTPAMRSVFEARAPMETPEAT